MMGSFKLVSNNNVIFYELETISAENEKVRMSKPKMVAPIISNRRLTLWMWAASGWMICSIAVTSAVDQFRPNGTLSSWFQSLIATA